MGQYYMPTLKREEELAKVYSHDFGNGLKLTEHSYVGNRFVNVVANALIDNPAQLYWCGDYAEEDDFESAERYKEIYGCAWGEKGRTTLANPDDNFDWSKDWYYINQTKKEYLLMPKIGNYVFSPISLLTAIGNGRGGGDYHDGQCIEMVGYWAGDTVLLSEEKPKEKDYVDVSADVDFGSDDW